MHKSGEQHTLTALSPKMSSFFISSVTRMSWRQRDKGHAADERQAGRGGPGQSGHGGAGVTVTPSASQYAWRGLLPSTKGVWWKLMAGDFLSLS